LLNHALLILSFAFAVMLARQSIGQTTSAANAQAPRPWDQNPNGMHIYIWAGLKSHSPGQHDYPQFLADWSKLLTERGAVVDGALHAPSAADLEHTDVVIIYKGDAAYIGETEKNLLEAYIKRGGGLVSLHDSLCGPDPAYFATLVGGAKKHGEVNYTLGAPIPYTIVDAAAGTHKGEVVPQIWTYEHSLEGGEPARAFVWMQGHEYANFENFQIRQMLLRGIAWAGKKPVDSLVDYVPPTPPRMQAPGTNK
jgi:type 1 glutamine amidotransferase